MQAHHLCCDALHLQNAALCGTAMTNFLDMMENFFGVEEDEEEAKMEDAASFAAFVKQNKEEFAKELQSKALSITKGTVEHKEIGDEEESKSVASTSSQASKPCTLSQMSKHKEKYPTKCKLSEAQLFYSTSLESLHETGMDGKSTEPERIFLAMKGYTVAALATVTMAHRYAVVLSHISDVST